MKMSKYQIEKENVREQAIEWQHSAQDMSYEELFAWTSYFYMMGRKYGLLREFRENGII